MDMKKIITVFIFTLALLTSCQDEYYFDGGLSDGELNMTTYDFLKSRPDQFEKLVLIIDKNELKDTINSANSTFFVPKDKSIERYLEFATWDDIQFLKLSDEQFIILGELLKSYIIPKKLPRSSIIAEGKEYENILGETVEVSFQQNPYNGVPGYGPKYVLFSRYVITEVAEDELVTTKSTATVSTSDLVSTNGIVHVLLETTHIFGL